MSKKEQKNNKHSEKNEESLQKQVEDLTADLQRVRADFENFRKRVEQEKTTARMNGEYAMVRKLIPVIDTIDRAIGHTPEEIRDNPWVKGVSGISKQLNKTLDSLDIKKIDASKGTIFNPDLHDAIQIDEDSEGEQEVIAEELQSGYIQNGVPIRHAMVKVERQ